jgi:acetyl esterase/lipase
MKKVFLRPTLAVSLIFYSCSLFSQEPCDSTPANCAWNLKVNLFTGLNGVDSRLDRSYKASTLPIGSKDVVYTHEEDVTNCTDPPADPPGYDCLNASASLKYDVWYPKNHLYDPDNGGCPLPAVILFHGGGYQECPAKEGGLMEILCKEFASRGFVAFNVEYRRGRVKDDGFVSVQQQLSIYRAAQDARGAIRSFIKRQRNHNSEFPNDPYQIDTTKIFIGGVSAGGIIADLASWYNPTKIAQVFPTDSPVTFEDALGSINADYYYGESNIDYRSAILGVLNCWGGIPVPSNLKGTPETFFSSSLVTPVIAFHGKKDNVIPFDEAIYSKDIKFSPNTMPHAPFNSSNECLITGPVSLENTASTPDLYFGSSLDMYNIAKHYNKLAELYIDCNMKHGIRDETQTYFGTGLSVNEDVGNYIVQRAATFFQAIMNNKTAGDIGPPSKFTDCENTRKKCDPPDNPNECSNNDACQ